MTNLFIIYFVTKKTIKLVTYHLSNKISQLPIYLPNRWCLIKFVCFIYAVFTKISVSQKQTNFVKKLNVLEFNFLSFLSAKEVIIRKKLKNYIPMFINSIKLIPLWNNAIKHWLNKLTTFQIEVSCVNKIVEEVRGS